MPDKCALPGQFWRSNATFSRFDLLGSAIQSLVSGPRRLLLASGTDGREGKLQRSVNLRGVFGKPFEVLNCAKLAWKTIPVNTLIKP
jgi:hypothetical protein